MKLTDGRIRTTGVTYSVCNMASISLICIVASVVVVVILEKARKILIASNWYKRRFAGGEAQFAETTRKVFAPSKEKIFADLNEHLKTVKGDVLEIGIGSGERTLIIILKAPRL